MSSFASLPLLVAQAGVKVEAVTATGLSTAAQAAIILGVIAGSFALGEVLARWLRMRDYNIKIGLVLATLLGAMAINVLRWPPKLGIDLSGGVVLVYEVDQSQMQESNRGQILEDLSRQLGTVDQQRLKVRLNADRQFEIPLPSAAASDKVKATVERLNSRGLGVKLVGQRTVDDRPVLLYETVRQNKPIDMDKLIGAVSKRVNPSGVKEVTVRQYGADQIEIIVPEVEEQEVEDIKRKISTSGELQFRMLANSRESEDKDLIELAQQSEADEVYQGARLKARWIIMRENLGPLQNAIIRQSPGRPAKVLVKMDDYNVNGDYLSSASPSADERGNLCISFTFNAQGAAKFGQLTSDNLPNKATGLKHELGIVLDNELQSAASILSTITRSGQITGRFTEAEVKFVVDVLNSGSLPAALQKEPISQQKISSQLGDDTIRSGTTAMMLSTVAVVLFMLIYYRFAGIVADVAVIMNMVLAVALMLLIHAAFTLPGLAGLVLTVGMAVDANVLIYERMREESSRGASLRMTIRNGFSRAMATIIDSNLTTVFTAIVLFAIGTDQIKGFAVSLFLGLMVSMYTAVYVARVIFDICERQRWLTRLNMMQIVGETHIDFVKWRSPAIIASLVVIGIGLVAVWQRGMDLLDIDFTGGSSVQILFKPGKELAIADVRQKIAADPDLQDVSVSSVGERNREYKVDTSQSDIQKVEDDLQKIFGDALATYSMKFDPPRASTSARTAPETRQPAAAPGAKAPAAKTPATKTPAQETPASPGDTAAPPASDTTPETSSPPASGSKAPASTDGSSRLYADASALALAGGGDPNLSALLLAQAAAKPAAKPPVASAAPKAAAKPAPAAPAAKAPATPAAPAAPAAAPAATTAASATTPAATTESAAPTGGASNAAGGAVDAQRATGSDATQGAAGTGTDETIEAAPKGSAATPAEVEAAEIKAAAPAAVATPTESQLHFGEEINKPTLEAMIQTRLEAAKLPLVEFELSNPQMAPQSTKGFRDWKLSIMLTPQDTERLLTQVEEQLASKPVFPSSSSIGGKVAGKTQLDALWALLASLAIIVVYVWIRFQSVMFGFAAVLALIHDVLVTIGFLALSSYLAPYFGFLLVDPFKISLAVVAALLTIVGYSINDTIVIFDRIREIRGKNPDLTEKMINDSVNQTLGRTLLTSGTVLIGTLILYFIGGPGIHAFAYAMLVGLISGTYSTVYIASPVLLWLKRSEPGQGFSTAARRTPAVR